MHKSLIQRSISFMSHDVNLVRITFLTSFFHSLIVIFLMLLTSKKLFVTQYENGLFIGKIADFIITEINQHHVVAWVVGITVFLFVLYSIIYPLGQAASIHYMHWQKGIRHSLKASLTYFFPMFEFSFVNLVFSPMTFFLSLYKVLIVEHTYTWGVLLGFSLWFVVMSLINSLKVYTRYFIVLQQMGLYEAIKTSIRVAWRYFAFTRKSMGLQSILLINFSLNILFVVGIPLLLMALSISYGIIYIWWVKLLVYLVFFVLVFLGAYLSSFIRAFFVYYWYEMYQTVKKG